MVIEIEYHLFMLYQRKKLWVILLVIGLLLLTFALITGYGRIGTNGAHIVVSQGLDIPHVTATNITKSTSSTSTDGNNDSDISTHLLQNIDLGDKVGVRC